MEKPEKNTITVMLINGYLPRELMKRIHEIATEYDLQIYLSGVANLRITGMKDELVSIIQDLLVAAGCTLKQAGRFPKPRTCVGKTFCNLGNADTHGLCGRILERFKDYGSVKPKIKIAIAGCARNCSNPKLADIGIVATAKGGFDLFAGGKGGGQPKIATQIAKNISEDELMISIDSLISFHNSKAEKKQRLCTVLSKPDFPYPLMEGL